MAARTPTVCSPLVAGSTFSTEIFSDLKGDSEMLPLKPKKTGYSVDDIEDLGISMPYLEKEKGCEPIRNTTRAMHPLNVDSILNNTPLDILEKKRIEHERQRQEQRKFFEEHMKLLEVRQMKEEQDLICEQQRHWNQQHQQSRDNGNASSSYSAPASSGSTTHNSPSDTRMRANTVCVVERNRGVIFSPPVESAGTPILHAECPESSATMYPSSLSTPSDRSASKSLPASRRNSGDMSTIWQNLEELGIDVDKESEDHVENDGVNHYRVPQVENTYFQSGRLSTNKGAQQRLGRNVTSDGTIGTFASNSRNQNNRTRFCTVEDEIKGNPSPPGGPSHVRSYLKLNTKDDRFPILVRRDSYPGMLSASSAALDLAPLPQMTTKVSSGSMHPKWPQELRDSSISSVPKSTVISGLDPNSNNTRNIVNELDSGSSIVAHHGASEAVAASTMPIKALTGNAKPPFSSSSTNEMFHHGLYTLIQHPHRSYGYDALASVPAYHDAAVDPTSQNGGVCKYFQQGSCTRGSRCTFSHIFQGDQLQHHHQVAGIGSGMISRLPIPQHAGPMHPMHLANSMGYQNNHIPTMGMTHEFFGINEAFPGSGMMAYLQRSVAHGNENVVDSNMMRSHANNAVATKHGQKRSTDADNKANRFAGVRLEDMVGDIYALCKDQHGCRYLQRKLEEQNEQYLDIIFTEVFGHFAELMIDPFGNYLCQKLLEYCTDAQRTLVVEAVSPELVGISLNMHGTRAVQKMIEYLSNTQQVHSITVTFSPNVVILIKDLNGNHVIQKCLNRLSSEDNQFIYDAVSQNCIDVATHRHGCCVLQRCIDHASDSQKVQLVTEITYNALTLVQDPFGNYVVQYVLDLGDARFSDPIIRRFIGNVCLLSVQKFSSNVMEKCIRVAENETRWFLIDEMLNRERLDKLLRDSYANYVVQTALDYADSVQRAQLVDCILPLLPAIRNTPYGKRIQCKLQRDTGTHMVQTGMPAMNMNALNGLNAHFGPTGFMATTMGPGYLYM